jgi:hypothetical protein
MGRMGRLVVLRRLAMLWRGHCGGWRMSQALPRANSAQSVKQRTPSVSFTQKSAVSTKKHAFPMRINAMRAEVFRHLFFMLYLPAIFTDSRSMVCYPSSILKDPNTGP